MAVGSGSTSVLRSAGWAACRGHGQLGSAADYSSNSERCLHAKNYVVSVGHVLSITVSK
uniref:Uncharacterized protein n=1 Tax=Setaria viridis TaxID=4556 RepID=A0A4U6VDQ3_SETVI|nr:hypothetical protein SEVIR_3G158650v2 [Setaria viridis]